jgi:hypothetical protein
MSAFSKTVDQMLLNMLGNIAEGEGLVFDDLVTKYIGDVPTKKKTRPAKVVIKPEEVVSSEVARCTSVTAKGKPCSMKPLEGKCVCRIHDKTPKTEPKTPKDPVKKPKKPKKPKKEQPEHTHELDDGTHSDCELCQSHGSPLAETDDEEEFELVGSPMKSLRERLSKISTYDDEEED